MTSLDSSTVSMGAHDASSVDPDSVAPAMPPTIASFNYTQGDVGGGGRPIIITGTNLSSASNVRIGGANVAPTSSSPTTCTFTLPAHAAGVVSDVQVTTPGGTSGTLSFEYWSPSVLTLTGWWRGSYGGAPWAGTASVGTSGSKSLVHATTDPGTGVTQGGFTAADCAGGSKQLEDLTDIVTDFVSVSAYTIFVLLNANSASAPDANPYGDPAILNDTNGGAYLGMGFNSSGVEVWHLAADYSPVITACSTGAWHLAVARYDGVNLMIRVDGGADASLAKGNISPPGADNIRIAEAYTGGGVGGVDAAIMEIGFMQSSLSPANIAKLRLYMDQRYGVSV